MSTGIESTNFIGVRCWSHRQMLSELPYDRHNGISIGNDKYNFYTDETIESFKWELSYSDVICEPLRPKLIAQ